MNHKLEIFSEKWGSFRCLPIAHALNRYDESNWICFGHLTYAEPISGKTAASDFKQLMDSIGWVNFCFGKRLDWFLRLEGGKEDQHLHLHFLLGGHKVTDGYHKRFTPESACDFLLEHWHHGIADIRPYEAGKGGVGYVTKIRIQEDRDDFYELSHSLKRTLIPKEIAA